MFDSNDKNKEKMSPPGIEPGSRPRQGRILAVGLWARLILE